MNKNFMNPQAAFDAMAKVFTDKDQRFVEYAKGRTYPNPTRWYRLDVATTPLTKYSFFTLQGTDGVGNNQHAGMLVDGFKLITSYAVLVGLQSGPMILAELIKLVCNSWLSISVDNRLYVDRLPLTSCSKGSGIKESIATADTTGSAEYFYGEAGASPDGYYDTIPYTPNQAIAAWIDIDTAVCASLTTAAIFQLELMGPEMMK